MDPLTPDEESWLADLEAEYACELSNQAIGSPHVKYASPAEARREMLRDAYRRGRNVHAPLTFDRAVQQVAETNAAAHDRHERGMFTILGDEMRVGSRWPREEA